MAHCQLATCAAARNFLKKRIEDAETLSNVHVEPLKNRLKMFTSNRCYCVLHEIVFLLLLTFNYTTNSKKYHYNGLATNIIMNYVIYKTDKDFHKILSLDFNIFPILEAIEVPHLQCFIPFQIFNVKDFLHRVSEDQR